MMIVLHPTYVLRVTVQPPDLMVPPGGVGDRLTRGSSWDEVLRDDVTGCDAVLATVRNALRNTPLGQHVSVMLEKYEHAARRS